MTVLNPDQFNEPFTIYLNADGQPVQRTLGEMTVAEVIRAIRWHEDEAERLDREAVPAREIAEAAEAGTLDPGMSDDTLRACEQALMRASEAQIKAGRLMDQVHTVLQPQWQQHPGMWLVTALYRYWPGGRAA